MARNHLEKMDAPDVRRTTPMPTTCNFCGFELPEDAERNFNYFVNFITCRDINRGNKAITGAPSLFLKIDENKQSDRRGKIAGSSAQGYILKDNYAFVNWTVFCVRCHSNRLMKDDMSRKTNHMIPDIPEHASTLNSTLNKLKELQYKQRMDNA